MAAQESDKQREFNKRSEANILDIYLKDTTKYRYLTHDEELLLGKSIKEGQQAQDIIEQGNVDNEELERLQSLVEQGQNARDTLASSSQHFVIYTAKKYVDTGMELLDLIQYGNLGLMKAVDRYDYTQGNRFGTFAYWWIRQSILRNVTSQARIVRLPEHVYNEAKRIIEAFDLLEQKLKRRPKPHEVAKYLGVEVNVVLERQWQLNTELSLNQFKSGHDDTELGEHLQYVVDIEELAFNEVFKQDIENIYEQLLDDTEIEIMRLRFPLDGNEQLSMEKIGKQMGMSKQNVSRIVREVLTRIRYFSPDLIDFYGS